MTRLLTLLLLLSSFAVAEEGIQPEDPKLGRPVDFYQDVYPILESKCLACHSGAVAESDLVLESAKTILKGGASGEAIVPGKPEESYLYMVSARIDEPVMPPLPNKANAKPLTSRELGILKQWITEGAKEGTPPKTDEIAWQPIPEDYRAVYSLAVSPNEQYVYAGRGNRIFVYDLNRKREVARLTDTSLLSLQRDGQPIYSSGVAHRDFVHAMAASPDGQYLASAGYRVVKLWEQQPPRELANIKLAGPAKDWVVDSSGTKAAFLLEDNSIQVWDLATGNSLGNVAAAEKPVNGIDFGADGFSLALADETGVRIVKLDGTPVAQLPTPQPAVQVAVRAKGPELIVAHADNKVASWAWPAEAPAEGAEPPKPIREFAGHSQPVNILKVIAADAQILTAAADGQVKIFDLENGQQKFSQNLGGKVLSAAVSEDGSRIAASNDQKLTRIWDAAGKPIKDIRTRTEFPEAVITATDNQAVAKSQFALADKALQDGEKDVQQREESLKKTKEEVEKAKKALEEAQKKFDEANKKAEEAAAKLAEKADDAALKKAKEDADKERDKLSDELKKAKDGVTSAERSLKLSEESIARAKEKLETTKKERTQAEEAQKQADDALAKAKEAETNSVELVTSLTFQDGYLVTAFESGSTQMWSAETGLGVQTLAGISAKALNSQNNTLVSLSADQTAVAWDIAPKWNLVGTLGGGSLDVSQSKFKDRVSALAFSPDGTQLVTGGGEPSRSGELIFWNVADQKMVREISDAHSDSIFDIEFSRDGQHIVTGAADKFVKVFDANTGDFVRSYEGHTDHVLGVAFKADNSNIASASSDNAIKVWNTETGEQIRTINNYSKQVTSLAYVGTSDNMISCSGDKTVKFHTASNGRNYRSFGGATDFVYSVYASRDESLVVAAGEDGVVRVWNGKDGKLLQSFEPPKPATETAQR